jgi:hypothetical protein
VKRLLLAPTTHRPLLQVLGVPDLVMLLWALAALQQYHTQLYRNAAFRATRLPDGVPTQPRLRRLLREATVLHSCEHQLDPVASDAATAILPAWMQPAATAAATGGPQAEAALAAAAAAATAAPAAPPAEPDAGASQLELRATAEAACRALQAAGLGASLKQLSYGDYIVVFDLTASSGSSNGSSGRKGGLQAAVVPGGGRTAVNDPHQLLGAALVAARVLEARGLAVVPGTGSEAELVVRCTSLLRRGTAA